MNNSDRKRRRKKTGSNNSVEQPKSVWYETIDTIRTHFAELIIGAIFANGTSGGILYIFGPKFIPEESVFLAIAFSIILSVAAAVIIVAVHDKPRKMKGRQPLTRLQRIPCTLIVLVVLFIVGIPFYRFVHWLAFQPFSAGFVGDTIFGWGIPLAYGICIGLLCASVTELLLLVRDFAVTNRDG